MIFNSDQQKGLAAFRLLPEAVAVFFYQGVWLCTFFHVREAIDAADNESLPSEILRSAAMYISPHSRWCWT